MPRKSTAKQASDAPAAAETATPVQGHPWFPDVDPVKIAKLVVQRIAYEDRKGLPGAGQQQKITLTPDPVPPSMLTTEAQIASAFGAGYFEVWAKDAANRFASGAPFVVQIAGPGGKVPRYVRELESDEEEDDTGGDSEQVKLLKLQVAAERQRRKDSEEEYGKLIREMRENHKDAMREMRDIMAEDRKSLGDLSQSIMAANRPAPSNGLATVDPNRDRLDRLEQELRDARKEAHELALAKLRVELTPSASAKSSSEEDIFDKAGKALPLFVQVKEIFDATVAARKEAAETHKDAPLSRDLYRLGEHVVPSLEVLSGARANGKTINPQSKMVGIFRRLHAEGMLPRGYETELRLHGITFGAEVDGDATGAPAPDGGDRAAVG